MSEILTGTVLDFPYTGAAEEITLPKGTYKLECWGAQGGSYSTAYGGRGGYVSGVLVLKEETKLFCRAGGQPETVSTVQQTVPGGFNGGGSGYCRSYSGTSTYGQGGGGASDVRVGEDSLYARVAVAGGGGGSAQVDAAATKYGGGEAGGSPVSGYGATQTSAGAGGSFGQGASCSQTGHNYKYGSAGGGGGWYGGGSIDKYNDSTNYRGYNGGGSGFVWTGINAPDGYLLTEEHYLTETQNIAGNAVFTSPGGAQETGHGGNGHVRITALYVPMVPSTPENFRIETETDTNIVLAWNTAEYATAYRLRRGGQLLADTEETTASVAVDLFAKMAFTLTAYNDEGESVPAELVYRKIPENPILFLVTDRTTQDVTAGNSKGYYAATDLNRVGCAVEYLAERLKRAGISVSVFPFTEWTDADWGAPSNMAHYLEQVRVMREALKLASAPDAPDDLEKFTYTEANNIEQILEMLDAHISNMMSIVDSGWTSGLAHTGFYAKEAY